MAGWTAANVSLPKRRRDEVGGSDDGASSGRDSGGVENKRQRRRSAETTEAALARLSSSYNAAMTAVGALHRASAAIAKTAAAAAAPTRTADDKQLSGGGSTLRSNADVAGTSKDAVMRDCDTTGRTPESKANDGADSIGQLFRVAKAARNALGGAILLDPLVRPYAPTWCQTMEELGHEVGDDRDEPVALTSSARRATVKELAYLVLVNYADLLVCGCCCNRPVDQNKSILDRGTVKVLGAFTCHAGGNCSCCWSGEAEEDTKRLALVAYCDASDLDKSDPTLWLKVACTARALGKIVARRRARDRAAKLGTPPDSGGQGDENLSIDSASAAGTMPATPPTLLSYHRLERYALESGLSCLSPDVPPNRAIVRALQELQAESDHGQITQYPSILRDDRPNLVELVIDLPRYSWSAVGRILMKACREGSAYGSHDHGHVHMNTADKFGSPSINIRISPLLTLPPALLGALCEFLGSDALSKDVKNLESTCRALSVDIISARAALEKERHQRMLLMEQEMTRDFLNEEEDEQRPSSPHRGQCKEDGDQGNDAKKNDKKAGDKRAKPTRSHRSSKRVLSQLITSGKQAERTAKRKSVEYCLVSVVFSSTTEHPTYRALLKKEVDWISLAPLTCSNSSLPSAHSPTSPNTPSRMLGSEASPSKERLARRIAESSARNGTSSLQSFIYQWSKHNSGPIDMLNRFVSHVSWHVDGVFSSETGGMMVLSSCVMDCFDLLTKRCGYRESLAPCWFGEESFPAEGPYEEVIKTFAINLLNAELRLRRCERHGISFDGYEDDVVCVSFMVPKLLTFLTEIKAVGSECTQMAKQVRALEIRCHWLAAIFYTWWSHKSAQLADVREAEARAMHHIDEVIKCLTQSGLTPFVIRTPHLESPGRSGGHWKELSQESVATFRNELQASSVVSRARHQFQQLKLHTQGQNEGVDGFSEQERNVLTDIGNELLERYGMDYEGLGGRHEELVMDFLTFHGTDLDLVSTDDSVSDDENKAQPKICSVDSSANKWGSLWNLVPSSFAQLEKLRSSSDPSLVSILVVCLQAREDRNVIAVSLLTRLAFAALDQYDILSSQSKDDLNPGVEDDSSVSSSDSEQESTDRGKSGNSRGKGRSSLLAARFLIEKVTEIVSICPDPHCVAEYATGKDFVGMMHKALILSSGKEYSSSTQDKLMKSPPDFILFLSISSLISTLLGRLAGNDESLKRLKSSTFTAFVELFVKMRRIFPVLIRSKGDSRHGRSERQTVCLAYAEYVSAVATEIACFLTQHQSTLREDGRLEGSYLIKAVVEPKQEVGPEKKAPSDFCPIVHMTESLLWFWKFIVSADVFENAQDIITPSTGVISSNSIDRSVAKCLVVPIASFITSLCGACGHGNLGKQDEQRGTVSLSDFCDTDDSANGWYSDEGLDAEEPSHTSSRSLLRVLVQAVQCCGLVFGGIGDSVACSNEHLPRFSSSTNSGPLLPLVVVRTLTHIADVLLTAFGSVDFDRRGAVWAEQYPYGARSAGYQLDALLHKAYRYLHGFALVSQNNQANSKKDLVCHSLTAQVPMDSSKFKQYAPESTKAAAQLYRCIRRAYPSKGRRSPPKTALECVSSALPPAQETERSKAIRSFVFSSDPADSIVTEAEDQGSIFDKRAKTVELLLTFPQWVLNDQEDREKGTSTENVDREVTENLTQLNAGKTPNDEEEIRHVRKGICEELAQGSLPRLGSGTTTVSFASPTKDDDQPKPKNESVERESTAQHEKALYRKFLAILDFLCYEPTDADAWYRAGLCLGFKADIICDRLTPLSDGYKGSDVFIPRSLPTEDVSYPLHRLFEDQQEDHKDKMKGWVPYLGNDLSHYIRYPWAKLSTLRSCSKRIKEAFENDCLDTSCDSGEGEMANLGRYVWNEIDSMFENGRPVEWEKAWGGIFIAALTSMSKRCFSTALYLSAQPDRPSNVDDDLFYEIAETAGTSCYAELMGSTRYGYPMKLMTNFQKRFLAKEAKLSFEAAIEFATRRDLEENIYDLHFMVGKCEEKIAKTLDREAFISSTDGSSSPRAYEKLMKNALASYATGLEEAKRAEKVRNLPDVQAGGSSHGLPEIVYRLHASRLKVLLSAIRRCKESREIAEREALRITRAHWYITPNKDGDQVASKGLRDEVWEVLGDIVAAMAQLRIDNQFFHRSVYHHAVALLWAPVLHDPEAGFSEGSLGSVPATKSYHLRGLNTGACANSAQAVISALFDKKRPQLCGVWVATTATPSPFEVLNDAVRKYDALRSKYVGAYIDIMRLCKRKDTLLTFLGWTDSCQRDLPTFYEASAALKGAAPERFHTKESLLKGTGFLWMTKRRANSAIADIILRDIAELGSTNDDVVTKRLDILRDAYSCFLRMNCPLTDKSWQAEKIEEGKTLEVEAVCKAYDALIGSTGEASGDEMQLDGTPSWRWKMSQLRNALEKCEEMFPELAPVGLGQKKRVKRKLIRSLDEGRGKMEKQADGKSTEANRKDSSVETLHLGNPPPKKYPNKTKRAKMVVVAVPEGLKEGDTFEHIFKHGSAKKKVMLTVPAGSPSKLKFKAPSSQVRSPKSKAKGQGKKGLTPGSVKESKT